MDQQKAYNEKNDIYNVGINTFLIDYVEENKNILDIGCNTGELGEYLKNNKQATVSGIDISDTAIQRAKQVLDQAACLNIENQDLPFKEKSFDVIICADVLEHLFDPLATLKKLKKYLKDDGFILISVPNIANVYVRLNLLLGRFNYQESGILDSTHVHFFTLYSIKQTLTKSGFKLIDVQTTPTYFLTQVNSFVLKAIHQVLFYNPLSAWLRKHWLKGLLASQFIIKASK